MFSQPGCLYCYNASKTRVVPSQVSSGPSWKRFHLGTAWPLGTEGACRRLKIGISGVMSGESYNEVSCTIRNANIREKITWGVVIRAVILVTQYPCPRPG